MAGAFTIAEKELWDKIGSKRFLIMFGLVVLISANTAYNGVSYVKMNPHEGFNYIYSGYMSGVSFLFIMVFFGPIVGLAMGFDAVNRERTNGTLSVLLSQPIYRDSVINGKLLAGAGVLSILVFGTVGIMTGVAIPNLGYGPTFDEFLRILTFTVLTTLYLVFWQSLGMLYSVLTKKTSISIFASIATWLVFSLFIIIFAGIIANALIPLPESRFISGESQRPQRTQEYYEARDKRHKLTEQISRLSPTNLYSEAANSILGVEGFTIFTSSAQNNRDQSLVQALVNNWANITSIIVALVICTASSYIMVLRMEIRPGE